MTAHNSDFRGAAQDTVPVQRATLTLTGQVRGASRPLAGVAVTLTDRTGHQAGLGRTGDDGRFEVTGLAPGDYLAILSRQGHQPQAIMVALTTSPVPMEVTLVASGSVHGTVLDRRTDRPVAAATVTALGQDGQVIASAVSDIDGQYELTGLDAPEVTLVVSVGGAEPFATVVQCSGTAYELDLYPEIYSVLGGTITHHGRPVADLPLVLRDDEGMTVATTVTDDGGGYRFEHVHAGTYTVDSEVSAPVAKIVAAHVRDAGLLLPQRKPARHRA